MVHLNTTNESRPSPGSSMCVCVREGLDWGVGVGVGVTSYDSWCFCSTLEASLHLGCKLGQGSQLVHEVASMVRQ